MPIGIKRKFLPISIICLICSTTLGLKVNGAVTNGADIYCFMRNGGNTHEPSWEAAYQFIKNKKQGLFKTSPKQAASLIVEEVVQNPIKYEDCINYLGDLFNGDSSSIEVNDNKGSKKDVTSSIDSTEKSPKGKYIDRYNY
ncbi:DUF6554 family protein [Prochlorococcus marinus]|uniref:DUF6554 family protein n=1 Tax=Prochlorococcus marinus TaxID=1219 RepID=UPI0039AF2989